MTYPIKINNGQPLLERLLIWIIAARAVTFVWLAFASSEYMPIYNNAVLILRYCTILLAPLYLARFSKYKDTTTGNAFFALIFYWLMLVCNTYGGYKGSYIHELVTIGSFLLMKEKSKIRVFEAFYLIVLASCAIGVFVFIAFIFSIPIGFETVPFLNDGLETSVYIKWNIFAIVGDGQYGLPRLCSIFNEPGGLGTVCGLLYAATYTYSQKWEKVIILMACLLSFSLAGYLLIFAFYAIHHGSRKIKYIIPIIGLMAFLLIAPSIDWGNEFVNDFVARFAITDEGLAGDDRVSYDFQRLWTEFNKSNYIFFGHGATYGGDLGTASYKNLLIQFGYVGFGTYFILWMLSAFKYLKGHREAFAFMAIFILSIYQRPVTITNSYGYTVFFGGLAAIVANSRLLREKADILYNDKK